MVCLCLTATNNWHFFFKIGYFFFLNGHICFKYVALADLELRTKGMHSHDT